MNEKKLIEETVGGSIERIKKELVHILVDDEEIKSLIISECGFILKERLAEELEKIRKILNYWANEHIDGDYYVRLKDINEVFDEKLAELKGEQE